jgi:hypothetical protein
MKTKTRDEKYYREQCYNKNIFPRINKLNIKNSERYTTKVITIISSHVTHRGGKMNENEK